MYHRLFSCVAALGLVSACAFGGDVERADPNDTSLSVVYGYIDMDEAPSDVDWVDVRNYDRDDWVYTLWAKDGFFSNIAVTPGPYQIDSFGANTGNTLFSYDFGSQGRNESAIRIDRPGAYFLGAYEYREVDTGWLEEEKFQMQPVGQPDEREILIRVLELIETEYPQFVHQIGLLRRRLAELGS